MTAEDLYDAKCKAIEHLRVPKSKTHLVAIEPAYGEDNETCLGWIAFYDQQKFLIPRSVDHD